MQHTNDIEKKLRPLEGLRLHDEEKAEMKASFLRFLDANPEPNSPAALRRSPFMVRLYAGALAAVLFFAYVGSAEAALPGDTMYYFKVHVNEPVVKFFAVTSELQADVTNNFLERRLKEASRMALDDFTTQEDWRAITAELDAASHEAMDSVQTLIAEGEFAAALDTVEEQQAVLDVHEAVITKLTEHDTVNEAREVLEGVEKHVEFTEQALAEVENKLPTQLAIQEAAQESFDELQEVFEQASSTLESIQEDDAANAAELKEVIEYATNLLDESQIALNAEDYDAAILKAEETQGLLTESLLLLEQEEELAIEVDAGPLDE